MLRQKLWLGMSLMVLVSFWTNRLPAQEIFVVPAVPYEPAHHPYGPPAFAVRPAPPPADHFLKRCLNNHGMGCGVDPFYPTCANCRYEMHFMFGSCRWYFNESCPPLPSHHGGKHGKK